MTMLAPSEASAAGPDDCTSLWEDFRRDGGDMLRLQLVARYMDFARRMAGSLYARRTYMELEFNDYLQFARVGLLEAVDRFDPMRGASFETFAALRINGAILNGIQSYSDMQEQVAARRRLVSDRVGAVRGALPDSEDPDAMFEYLAGVAIGLAVGFALDNSGMYQAQEPECLDNTYTGVEMRQFRSRLIALLQMLPERPRRVLQAHYLQQVSFEEVASMLGLSRGRISQLHKEGLQLLREKLRNSGAIDFIF